MDPVIVADLETPEEAQLARGLLRAHGIPAEITLHSEILPSTFTGRVSGTMVAVPAAFAEEARALLPDATPSPAAPGSMATSAPSGGSGHASDPGTAATTGTEHQPVPATSAQLPAGAPLAGTRASRPRWAVVLVLLLLVLVGWLLVEASGLLVTTSAGPSEDTSYLL